MKKKPKPSFYRSEPNYIGKVGEKKVQKSLGGKLTPGSRGGDLRCGERAKVLIEKKSTEKQSIILKKDYLEKIDRIAFGSNSQPVLVVEFEVLKRSACSSEWAVVPIEFFRELLELRNNSL